MPPFVESQPEQEQEDLALHIGGVTIQPGGRIGPYVYQRPIGKGGMATVVLARDPNDDEVALKILKPQRFQTGRGRFKREFRALSRIRHPNVIRVDAYADIHSHPYIVMEYVEGKDLHQTIREFKYLENADERWRRCEEILIDICRALAHVHQRGLVHRDLKPSNILLDHEGRAKLTDFGIVKDLDLDEAFQSRTLVGTWAYASPEQISGEPIDHRSDLYSLGIILFAMLTGCRPFDAKDMKGYLELHRNRKPPRPRQYDRRIPRVLDEICVRLLQKAPKDRYQHAQEILYRLEQLEAESIAGPSEGWKPPLVGRSAEKEILVDAVDRLVRREGGVVVLEGREGTGRTRLLRMVRHRANGMGIPVHWLDAGQGPAELFGLIDFCREVCLELGERAPAPLRQALDDWSEGRGRGGDAVYRLMDSLRPAVMDLLGDGPRILLYDDFHLLPGRGLELVANLIRGTLAIGEPVLLVLSARTEGVRPATEAFLGGDGLGVSPTRLTLEDLSLKAVTRMAESLLGEGSKATVLAERLHRETQGNPLFVTQFLSSLMQQGILVPARVGRLELTADTEEIATGHLEIPPGVRQVVRGRLADLAPDELEVLRALAVSRGPLDLDLMLEVLDQDEDQVLDTIDALIGRGIVVERRTGELVYHDVAHRLIGNVVYRELSPERRSELHRRLAAALERHFGSASAAIELIGEHYRLGGQAGKAYTYLVAGAGRMEARSLPVEAMELVTRAGALEDLARVDLDTEEFEATRIRLLQVRASVVSVRGEWKEARKTYEALLKLAEKTGDDRARVDARRRLASTLRRLGEADAGREEARKALAEARETKDRDLVARALYAMAVNAWDDGQPKEVERYASEGLVLTSRNDPSASQVRGEMLLALSIAQASQGRVASACKNMEEAVERFAELGVKHTHCLGLCNMGEMLLWQGRLVEGRSRVEEALELAREISYRMGEAMALRVRGEANLELGLEPRAIQDLEASMEVSSQLGLSDELIAARYCLARMAADKGDATVAEGHVAVARGLAERSDPERYGPALVALNAWCCAITGDHSDAARMLDVSERNLDKLPVPRRAQVMLGAARAYTALGRRDDARRLADQATSLARSRGFRLLELGARMLLSRIADDGAAAQAWRAEALNLAQAFDQELGPELARSFRTRPELADLYGE